MATIALPPSEILRGEETEKTTFWFYQQTEHGVLRLENFGSNQYGWWKVNGLGTDPTNITVMIGNIDMGEYINRPAFLTSQEVLNFSNFQDRLNN